MPITAAESPAGACLANLTALFRIIETYCATLKYLLPYSPDLNPIEQVFAKIKALLRKTAERTVDQHWQTLGTLLDEVQVEKCPNYFKNAGYVFNS